MGEIAILSEGDTDGKNTHFASNVTVLEWQQTEREFERKRSYTGGDDTF